MNNKTPRAIATLVGTTIGAGIFALPYAVTKVGLAAGIFYLLILGVIVLLLNLIYGEVILRTPGDHQLTGYGEIYLGKIGKILATGGLFIGLYGALLAYLIKIGQFLSLVSGLPYPLLLSLVFFVFASLAIYFGLKTVSKIELFLVILMLLFIVTLALVGLPNLFLINYQSNINLLSISRLLFPYGVILFALTGSAAIPEMEEILRHEPKKLKKSILAGSLIPLVVYLVFIVVILGISGPQTSEDAIGGLHFFLPNWIVKFGASLGILTMSTSFLALGYVLSEVWHRDFHLPKPTNFFLALLPPLLLFLLGTRSFIQVLEYSGALTGGITGILIIGCFWQAKKLGQRQPAYSLKIPQIVLLIIGLVFFLGILSPFFSQLGG